AQYYRYPVEFEKVIYATQLLQADAVRVAVEHFRRNRGRCMGALYWQLNDCWPVTSWASIDYEGRSKALYDCSKKFFAPLLLSADVKEDRVVLNLSSERREPFVGTAAWRLKDTDLNLLCEDRVSVTLDPLSAKNVATVMRSLIPSGREHEVFLEYELYSESGESVFKDCSLFVTPKHFAYRKPSLRLDVRKNGDGKFWLELGADVLMRKIKVSFSDPAIKLVGDQYFDMTDHTPIRLSLVVGNEDLTERDICAAVSVLSEADLC
ncbi:MAG: glycoside hydrolase family 2 protein, partial [Clostridia bacterium]|nr:glycoside hydrolase family 2 protein [Clostridia bacterium]